MFSEVLEDRVPSFPLPRTFFSGLNGAVAVHHTVHALCRSSFYLAFYLLSESPTSTHFCVQAQSKQQFFMFLTGPLTSFERRVSFQTLVLRLLSRGLAEITLRRRPRLERCRKARVSQVAAESAQYEEARAGAVEAEGPKQQERTPVGSTPTPILPHPASPPPASQRALLPGLLSSQMTRASASPFWIRLHPPGCDVWSGFGKT